MTLSHNVDDVIADIDDVEGDLRSEMQKRVGMAMDTLEAGVRQYVMRDPNYSTKLLRNIDSDSTIDVDELSFSVFVDTNIVEYAAVVEYGSGRHTDKVSHKLNGNSVPAQWPDDGSAVPRGYPFSAPDLNYNYQNPYDTANYEGFGSFVATIMEWMKNKPVKPLFSLYISAVLIAQSIVDNGSYAHPYLRPAWFDNKPLIVKASKNALKNATR